MMSSAFLPGFEVKSAVFVFAPNGKLGCSLAVHISKIVGGIKHKAIGPPRHLLLPRMNVRSAG